MLAGIALTAVAGALAVPAAVSAAVVRQSRGRVRELSVRSGDHLMFVRTGSDAAPPGRVPVVLVHGAVVSSVCMIPTLVRLAPDFPVYAPDLPGYGGSAAPPLTLTVPEQATALAAWLDAMRLDRVAIVGHSLGAQIAADLAARWPARVERLVLIGPTVEPLARRGEEQLARLAADIPLERPAELAMCVYDVWRAGLPRVVATLRVALEDRIEDKLPHVSARTLVVRGEHDPVVSRAWAQEVADLVRADTLIEIAGGSHALAYGSSAPLAQEVRRFLLAARNR